MKAKIVEKDENSLLVRYTAQTTFEGIIIGMISFERKKGWERSVSLTASSGGGGTASATMGGTNFDLINDMQKKEK